MGDNLKLPERNCARTPMQWSNEPQAGFTTSTRPVLPLISDGPYGYHHVNVADQRRNPESQLNWMERIVRMRKEVPEIGWGDFSFLNTRTVDVLGMVYTWRNNSVITIHNLCAEPREITFALPDGPSCELSNLLSHDHSEPGPDGRHTLLLEPYGYRWYRLCGLDYLLKRSPI
jgi:maltose alpha-D-glucosyltransferase / alpha-amylase